MIRVMMRGLGLIVFLLFSFVGKSQLSGTYTIGGTSPDYTTISAAVSALNSGGVSGPVIFNIRSGTYTEQIKINTLSGVSSSNKVVFQKDPSAATNPLIQFGPSNTSTNYVWNINGADYVELKNLHLKTTDSTYGTVIYFTGASTNILVDGCKIEGYPNRTNYGYHDVIYNRDGTGHQTTNSTISNNIISGGIRTFKWMGGSETVLEAGNKIVNNEVSGFGLSGIYAIWQDGIEIRNNYLHDNVNYSGVTGIQAYYLDNNSSVTNNELNMSGTVSITGMLVQYCDGTSSNKVAVNNNMISIISSSTSNTLLGLHSYVSNYNDIYFNTINLKGGSANAVALKLDVAGVGTYTNNKAENNCATVFGFGRAVEVTVGAVSANYLTSLDYNNYYSSGGLIGRYGSSNYTTLAAWKTGSGKDLNSVNYNPVYYSDTDLHANSALMNDKGKPGTGITVDFDGQTRNGSTPDIGADEYSPLNSMSGVYTIGGTTPNFSNISQAVDSLNSKGVHGAVTFHIRQGTYNEQVTLDSIPGASLSNPVLFISDPSNSTSPVIQYSSNSTNNYTWRFDGADYVTLRKLKINSLNASYSRVVDYISYTDYIEIDSCEIHSAKYSIGNNENNTCIYHGSGATNMANNCTIRNSRIANGSYGIILQGNSTSSREHGHLIENNQIDSVWADGIRSYYQDSIKVRGNYIHTHDHNNSRNAIRFYGNYLGFEISGNNIYMLNANGAVGINIDEFNQGTAANPNRIFNNMINCDQSFGSLKYGIANNSSTTVSNRTKYLEIDHNTVRISGASGNAFYTRGADDLSIRNNVFSNLGGGPAFYIQNGSSFTNLVSDYNDLYTTGTNIGYSSGNRTTLAAWRTATSQDANSISVNPNFISATDLHASNASLVDAGIAVTGISIDYDDENRANPPCIGADEFAGPVPLSGIYTIGGTTPDYATISAAISDLKTKGVDSSVTFHIRQGTYNEQVSIGAVAGVSSRNTIRFMTDPSSSSRAVWKYTSNHVLKLDSGAAYMSFDSLTFVNITSGYVIHMADTMHNISFDANVFYGDTSSYNASVIYDENGMNLWNISITNNELFGGENSIRIQGGNGASLFDSNIVIVNNQILNWQYFGIHVARSQEVLVQNNKVRTDVVNGWSAPLFSTWCSKVDVIGNRFYSGNQGFSQFWFDDCDGTSSDRSIFANNEISFGSGISNYSGHKIELQKSDYVDFYNNSFYGRYDTTNLGLVRFQNNSNSTFRNNVVQNDANGYAIYQASTSITKDYNNIYGNGGSSNVNGGSMGSNSISVNPYFLSLDSLYPRSISMDNKGTSISGNTTDITGATRNGSTPDIGAYEFTGVQIPMSGIYTIGGSNPDFVRIDSAVANLIGRGINGPVTFNIRSGTYNEQITIDSIIGASSTNTVTFQSDPSNSARPIITYGGSFPNYHTIMVKNADFISFKNLDVRTSGGSNSRVFALEGRTNNIVIDSSSIVGSSSFNYIIYHGTNDTDLANYFVVQNCDVQCNDGRFLYMWGSSLNFENGNQILNNRVTGARSDAISAYYHDTLTIDGNYIEFDSSALEHVGARLIGVTRLTVSNNEIITNTSNKSYAIVLNGSGVSTRYNEIYNNVYYNQQTTSSEEGGFYHINGSFNNIHHNTFWVKSSHSTLSNCIVTSNDAFNSYKNNNLVNTGGGFAIRIIDTASPSNDYNNMYTTGAHIGQRNNVNYTDLATWQSSTSLDANSVSFNPTFLSSDSLVPNNGLMNNAGTPISGITTDINGTTRNTTNPDIGAYEFTGVTPPLAGAYTVGGTTPDYPTIDSAVIDLLTKGVSDTVDFHIRPGTYDGQYKITAFSGMGAANAVQFRRDPNSAGQVTLKASGATSGANYILWLESVSNLSFSNLRFDTNTVNNNRQLYISGISDSITIDSCYFNARADIAIESANDTTDRLNYFTLSNSTISKTSGGGIILGFGHNYKILNNKIIGFGINGGTGIFFEASAGKWTNDSTQIIGNYIKSDETYQASSQLLRGIRLAGGRYGSLSNNEIYLKGAGKRIVRGYAGECRNLTVTNNVISITGKVLEQGHAFYCYYLEQTNVYYNTFYLNVTDINGDAISGTAFTGTLPGNQNNVKNNILVNMGSGSAIVLNTNSTTSDYNNIYAKNQSLSAWQSANSGWDVNSDSLNPLFCGDTLIPGIRELVGTGSPIAGYTTDILDSSRNASTPTVGAYEYTYKCRGLAGTYTIGGTTPDYTSIAEAVEELNCKGICDDVTFNIRQGTYIGHYELSDVYNSPDSGKITFQADPANFAEVILYDSLAVGENLFEVNNMGNLEFKKLNFTGEGYTYSTMLSISAYVKNVLIDSCGFNTIQHVHVGLGTYGISRGVDSVEVSNCVFKNSAGGVGANSTQTLSFWGHPGFSSHVSIHDNQFDSCVVPIGIQQTKYFDVSNNLITNARDGIRWSHCKLGNIKSNKISVSTTGIGIGAFNADDTTYISNNVVNSSLGSAISSGHTSSGPYFIYHNTLVSHAANSPVFQYGNSSFGVGSPDLKMFNNLLVHTSGGNVFKVEGNASQFKYQGDNNDYYSAADTLFRLADSSATTLSQFTYYFGVDSSSVSVNPNFQSDTVLIPNSPLLDSGGVFIAGITTDILDVTRTNPPDIGAYEFQFTPLVAVVAADDSAKCFGDSIMLWGSANFGAEYAWMRDGVVLSDTTDTLYAHVSGAYQAIALFGSLSDTTDTLDIILSNPQVQLVVSDTNFCAYDSLWGLTASVSGGLPSYQYFWSDSSVVDSLSNLSEGFYSLSITDSIGCIGLDTITLVNYNDIVLSATITTERCRGSEDGQIALSVQGDFSPYSFSWSNNDTVATASGLATGDYIVTVQDSKGCSVIDTFNVGIESNVTLGFVNKNVSCFGFSDGNINLAVAGGVSPYVYTWSDSSTAQDPVGLTAGTYIITVVDSLNCTYIDSTVISQPPTAPQIVGSATNDTICLGDSITLTGSGGVTYSWNNGAVNGVALAPTVTRNYILTGKDTNNCFGKDTVRIVVDSLPTVGLGSDYNLCVNEWDVLYANPSSSYDYLWSNASTADSLIVDSAGSYWARITDDNGCINTDTILISPDTIPIPNLPENDSICAGGSFNLFGVVNNQYSYSWSNGESTPNISIDSAAQYFVTVTDQNNCSNVDSFELSVIALPVMSFATSIPEQCDNGLADSLIQGRPIGGAYVGTYSGAGVMNNTIHPLLLNPGSYPIRYTVVDTSNKLNCTNYIDTSVIVNSLPNVQVSTIQDICINSGLDTITEQNPKSFTTGRFFGDSAIVNDSIGIFNPLISGAGQHSFYYAYVDSNGCTDTALTSITVLDTTLLSFNATLQYCVNDTFDILAEADSVPSGRFGSYVGNGVVNGKKYEPSRAGYGQDTLTYTYTNIFGCLSTTDRIVQVDSLPIVGLFVDDTCRNSPAIVLTGGFPAGGTYYNTVQGTLSGDSLHPGSYSAGIHTMNYWYENSSTGCRDTGSTQMTIFPKPIVKFSIDDSTDERCIDATALSLSGFSPIGGFFTGNGLNAQNNQFLPATAGEGTHEIVYHYTDVNHCTDSVADSIVVHDLPVVSISYLDSICVNALPDSITGGLPLGGKYTGFGVDTNAIFRASTVGAGVNKTITYTYSDSITGCTNFAIDSFKVDTVTPINMSLILDICLNAGIDTLTEASINTGNYIYKSRGSISKNLYDPYTAGVGLDTVTYVFTNDYGCKDSIIQPRMVHALPVVAITLPSSKQEVCNNESPFALTFGSPVGGLFSPGKGIVNNNFRPSSANIGANSLIYTYTDTNSCTNADTSQIVVNASPVVSMSSDTFCINVGNQVLSLGTPNSNGIGRYSGKGMINDTTFSPTFATIGNNNITYSFTDTNGCVNSASGNLRVNGLPVVNFVQPPAVCGNTDTFKLTGGTSTANLTYYTGIGIIDSSGSYVSSIVGNGVDTVTYIGYNAISGCSNSISRILVVDSVPAVTMDTIADLCDGAPTFTLVQGKPKTSGQGVYSGSGVLSGRFFPNIAGIGTHQISYTFTNLNGCSNSDTTTISIYPNPSMAPISIPDFCLGEDSIVLTGALPAGGTYTGAFVDTANAFGPDSVGQWKITYSYTDTNGCSNSVDQYATVRSLPHVGLTFDSALCINASKIPLQTGSPLGASGVYKGAGVVNGFYVTDSVMSLNDTLWYVYEDNYGCIDSASQPIRIDTLTPIHVTGLPFICEGQGPLKLGPFVTPSGGRFTGGSIVNNTFYPKLLTPGGYFYTYTHVDSNGCTNTFNDTLSVRPLPQVSLNADTSICNGNSVTLVASGGLSYKWDNGDYRSTRVVSPMISTLYTVTVSNEYNCARVENVRVSVLEQIQVFATTTGSSCGKDDGAGFVTVSRGKTPYNYFWSNGERTATVRGLKSGVYVVTVQDANRCSQRAVVNISDNDGPVIAIGQVVNNGCYGESKGSITTSASGGNGVLNYVWNNGLTSASISGLSAGRYDLRVTDEKNCKAVASVQITQASEIVPLADIVAPQCDSTNGQIIVEASGGAKPFNFSWLNGVSGNDTLKSISAGFYSLVISDSRGCTDTSTYIVSNNGAPDIRLDSIIPANCSSADGGIFITPVGNVSSYLWSNADTTQDAMALTSGVYSVTASDSLNCKNVQQYEVPTQGPGDVSICYVSANSSTGINELVWDTTGFGSNVSYNVYRESSTIGNYFKLATLSPGSAPLYADNALDNSTLIGHYLVKAENQCGAEGETVKDHTSILASSKKLNSSVVQVNWTPYAGQVVNQYYIYRYSTSAGSVLLDSILSPNSTFIDYNAPLTEETLYYYVSAINQSNCAGQIPYISSNFTRDLGRKTVGLDEIVSSEYSYRVWPNPNNGEFNLELSGRSGIPLLVRLFDNRGQIHFEKSLEELSETIVYSIKLSDISNGVYYLQIVDSTQVNTTQIVVSH